MAFQAVLVFGCALWLAISAATGSSSGLARAITEAVTIAVFAAGAAALSIGLWRERSIARTPSLVWDGFMAFIGLFLARSGAPLLGVVLLVIGVAAFVLALRVPALRDDDV